MTKPDILRSKTAFSYLGKVLYDQKIILIMLIIFCFAFEYFFAWLMMKSALKKTIETYFSLIPSSALSFIGIGSGKASLSSQLLAFGYRHPLVMICLMVLPVSLPSRYISGEVEAKTFDFILTRPFSRITVPLSLYCYYALAMLLLFLFLFLGTAAGNALLGLGLDLTVNLKMILAGYFFYLGMGALTFLIAAFQDERGKALSRIIGTLVFLFLFDTLIRLNESLHFLKNYSFFQLYQPVDIARGKAGLLAPVVISLSIAGVCLSLAVIRFRRRDL